MDEYMKQQNVKLFRSPSKGGTLELGTTANSPEQQEGDASAVAGVTDEKDLATKAQKRRSAINATAEV